EGVVGLRLDRLAARRLVEARPAAARLVLRVGDEELGAAARTAVDAVGLRVVEHARPGALGALLAEHVVLLGRQLATPLLVSLLNLLRHGHRLSGRRFTLYTCFRDYTT